MKKFKELNMNEQHREKGRFHPTIPRNVQSVATATPRKESDSANVKLKEEAGDSVNMDAPVGSQHREGDTPAGRTYIEKPQKEPMPKYKEIKEQLNVRTPSVEEIAKKHGVSKEEIETQLKSAIEVEKEHTTNQKDAREIALDHLNEKPDYYKKLKKFVEHTQLDEGRPSQRHPLEGHDYHRKTNAELIHIAKDAHAAAEAMKSHNTTAENKYRDQANDSATVRHWRKMNGTPAWYQKKYGIKESRDVCPVCGCTPCNCTHIDLQEGKMGQIHADIGEHLDKHIADYKAHGGAEHLGAKTVKAAGHIAKLHGIEQKHAQKFVNDYVDSKLKEETELDEAEYKRPDWVPTAKGPKKVGGSDRMIASIKEKDKLAGELLARKKEQQNEAWNQPDYSQSIQARQAKADAEKLPFKPEKGVKHSTPGKFGSGYSTARNLARQALKQQAAKLKPMKESEESRKATIIKDVAKKAKKKVESDDKFNPDPILTSDIQKS